MICKKNILNYLLKLSKSPLNDNARETVDCLFNVVNDIERVGDHSENIAELGKILIENNLKFSDEAINELNVMYEKVISTYTYAIEAMKKSDVELAYKIIKMEEQVDIMEKSARQNHMTRLNNNTCNVESGVLYLDMLSNLERISDHSLNIAQQVISGRIVFE